MYTNRKFETFSFPSPSFETGGISELYEQDDTFQVLENTRLLLAEGYLVSKTTLQFEWMVVQGFVEGGQLPGRSGYFIRLTRMSTTEERATKKFLSFLLKLWSPLYLGAPLQWVWRQHATTTADHWSPWLRLKNLLVTRFHHLNWTMFMMRTEMTTGKSMSTAAAPRRQDVQRSLGLSLTSTLIFFRKETNARSLALSVVHQTGLSIVCELSHRYLLLLYMRQLPPSFLRCAPVSRHLSCSWKSLGVAWVPGNLNFGMDLPPLTSEIVKGLADTSFKKPSFSEKKVTKIIRK